jgi:hypothetical protein
MQCNTCPRSFAEEVRQTVYDWQTIADGMRLVVSRERKVTLCAIEALIKGSPFRQSHCFDGARQTVCSSHSIFTPIFTIRLLPVSPKRPTCLVHFS